MLGVFIKCDVGAFFTTFGCSLVPSNLLTVSVRQQENKSFNYLCIVDTVEAVKLSSFSPCLKWFFLIVGICHQLERHNVGNTCRVRIPSKNGIKLTNTQLDSQV